MLEGKYEAFVRQRITQLRLEMDVTEHKMSLELGKSGSYIRSITSGAALPSLKELFNIMAYFKVTPSAFFAPLEDDGTLLHQLHRRLEKMDESDREKVSVFLDWIKK